MQKTFWTALAIASLLAGCGDMKPKLWPFSDSGPRERAREPADATAYDCSGGKRFHVRKMDGESLWLVLPEREVRLDRLSGNRYGKGALVLELGSDSASLADGAATPYTGCAAAGK